MRTPNAACMVCQKPFYRRPRELANVRHVACMEHRALAQSLSGVTDAQRRGLALGSVKGTNHRTGYKHREESKAKVSAANKAFWAANPDKRELRAQKVRGELNYMWKGGVAKLNKAIRTMTENRNWMDAVKDRDRKCLRCGSIDELQSHHKITLAALIEMYGVTSLDDARKHKTVLWKIDNGETLCEKCHHQEHGRAYREPAIRRQFSSNEKKVHIQRVGSLNPNWKGGKVERVCLSCDVVFFVKKVIARRGDGKFCSRRCAGKGAK